LSGNKYPLIACGIFSEITYLFFYFVWPLKERVGEKTLVTANEFFFHYAILLLPLSLLVYIFSWLQIEKVQPPVKIIFFFFFLFNITLLFVPPITSNDIYSYIYQARVFSVHHANPYLASYSQFKMDDFYPVINNRWSSHLSPYGPLFIYLTGLLTIIFKHSLLLTLLSFKIFFVAANALTFWLMHKIFKDKTALLLYGWNPLILFEISLNGHNDIIIIFLLMAALAAFHLSRTKHFLSWAAILLSFFVKITSLIFSPFILLGLLSRVKGAKKRIFFFLLIGAFSLFIMFLFYFPFWEGEMILIHPFYRISQFESILLVSPLISMFSTLGFCGTSAAITLSRIIFIAAYLILIIKFALTKEKSLEKIIGYSLITFLFFLLTFFNWLMPWYFTILIFFAAAYAPYSRKNSFAGGVLIMITTFIGISYYLFLR